MRSWELKDNCISTYDLPIAFFEIELNFLFVEVYCLLCGNFLIIWYRGILLNCGTLSYIYIHSS